MEITGIKNQVICFPLQRIQTLAMPCFHYWKVMFNASVNARKKEQGLGKIHVAQITGTKGGRALRPSTLTLRKETPLSLLIGTVSYINWKYQGTQSST